MSGDHSEVYHRLIHIKEGPRHSSMHETAEKTESSDQMHTHRYYATRPSSTSNVFPGTTVSI